MPSVTVRGAKSGLKFSTFDGAFTEVSGLNQATAVATGVTPKISAVVANKAENFGLILDGYIKIVQDGVYTFYLASDDGSMLWIDDTLAVSNDGLHGSVERSGVVGLRAGFHKIKIAYIQATGGVDLRMSMKPEGGTKAEVVAGSLFYK